MTNTLVPQPYGLRLEMMLARGLSPAEALALIRRGDAAALGERVNPELNWEGFVVYAQANDDRIAAALQDGYAFPFLTIGGMKNLLSIKFGLAEERDYRYAEGRIEGLRLTADDLAAFRRMVPSYWQFALTEAESGGGPDRTGTAEIAIEMDQRGGR
ncbi:hypothetical protein [Cohnella nanjingensis]|uniref:Uncharacterized protein n=1 Tax=Cohnella nanjingensis TaxID=1387779 RepID=A0A7X0VIE4_9BACL|nr:hypothetical protein [Cohnella nanjingensis]MBB6673584.1 hypothetical protein [Cohnella nanjingensis]